MTFPEDVVIQKQLTEIRIQTWLKYTVFQPRWWVLIVGILAIIVIWCIFVRKARFIEISLYFTLAAVVFLGFNEYGEELAVWDYPTVVIALFPPLSSIKTVLIPVVFSLIHQFCAGNKQFIIASLAASLILGLIIDPVLTAGRFFMPFDWKYYESIPVYFLTAAAVRAAVKKIGGILDKHQLNLMNECGNNVAGDD